MVKEGFEPTPSALDHSTILSYLQIKAIYRMYRNKQITMEHNHTERKKETLEAVVLPAKFLIEAPRSH